MIFGLLSFGFRQFLAGDVEGLFGHYCGLACVCMFSCVCVYNSRRFRILKASSDMISKKVKGYVSEQLREIFEYYLHIDNEALSMVASAFAS